MEFQSFISYIFLILITTTTNVRDLINSALVGIVQDRFMELAQPRFGAK